MKPKKVPKQQAVPPSDTIKGLETADLETKVFEMGEEMIRRGAVMIFYSPTGFVRKDGVARARALREFCQAHHIDLRLEDVKFDVFKEPAE